MIVEESGEQAGFADRRVGPERAALAAETVSVVEQGLLTLPDDQRIIVVLCDVQGLSYEEAAEAEGRRPGDGQVTAEPRAGPAAPVPDRARGTSSGA